MVRLSSQTEASTNEVLVDHLTGWMTAHGEVEKAQAWIESLPPDVQRAQPVPLAIVQCLLALKDWTQLESSLKTRQWAA